MYVSEQGGSRDLEQIWLVLVLLAPLDLQHLLRHTDQPRHDGNLGLPRERVEATRWLRPSRSLRARCLGDHIPKRAC